jgi:hypothetical protein
VKTEMKSKMKSEMKFAMEEAGVSLAVAQGGHCRERATILWDYGSSEGPLQPPADASSSKLQDQSNGVRAASVRLSESTQITGCRNEENLDLATELAFLAREVSDRDGSEIDNGLHRQDSAEPPAFGAFRVLKRDLAFHYYLMLLLVRCLEQQFTRTFPLIHIGQALPLREDALGGAEQTARRAGVVGPGNQLP